MPHFANYPVITEVEWPRAEITFSFGPHEIVAFPSTREHDASLHIDLERSKITDIEGRTVLNQLLSIAAWLDNTYAALEDGGSGTSVPVRPQRRTSNFPTSILDVWTNQWQPINDPLSARALAIYREAVNQYQFFSIPYALLGFFKLIEPLFKKDEFQAELENELKVVVPPDAKEDFALRELNVDWRDTPKLVRFLNDKCRNAIAHARGEDDIDPDNAAQVREMSVAANIVQRLARRYVARRHNIGFNRWDQSDIG